MKSIIQQLEERVKEDEKQIKDFERGKKILYGGMVADGETIIMLAADKFAYEKAIAIVKAGRDRIKSISKEPDWLLNEVLEIIGEVKP